MLIAGSGVDARGYYVTGALVAIVLQWGGALWAARVAAIARALAAGHPRRARALIRLVRRRWLRPSAQWLTASEAWGLFWEGSYERGIEVANRLVARDPARRWTGRASLVRAGCLVLLDRRGEARSDIVALRDGMRAVGEGTFVQARAHVLGAIVTFQDGDWTASRNELESGERWFPRSAPWRALARFYLAAIAQRQGRPDDCRRFLTDVLHADEELAVVRLARHAQADLFPDLPMPWRYARPLRQPRAAAGWRVYVQDLWLGSRYLCLQPPVKRAYSYAQIAALFFANLAVLALLRATEYVHGGALLTFRVGLALVPITLLIPSTFVMARILRPSMDPARLTGALLSVLPPLTALEYLGRRLMRLPDDVTSRAGALAKPIFLLTSPIIATLAVLWAVAVVVTLARRVAPGANMLRIAAAGTVFYMSWLPPTVYATNGGLWARPAETSEETEETEQSKLAPFLYEQADAVRDAEATLLPERPGVTDLYFVAVGAWGRQDVFLHEGRFAQNLFDRRFDTRGRSLALVDDPARPTAALPLKQNLLHALRAIGARMNPEEDILGLFVTSHGSAQGVAFSLGGTHRNVLDEQTLSPTELREALDGSGILWRVLIISACQSGVFVTPLQNDNTLIVTAASTDRLSFGCGNGVEFTEFGRALLADELTQERSFVTAFGKAIELVHVRELEQHRTPSLPQLFVGRAIGEKLRAFEHRLESSPAKGAQTTP